MSWFLLSLIAILFWSGSDLFSKMGSREKDCYSHWKMVMFVGLVMGIHGLIEILTGTPFHIQDMISYAPASILYISSMIIGYAGLRYIVLSVSSPICNSSGAVAALLCFFLLDETMDGIQLTGVILICAGVFALSVIEKRQDSRARLEAGEKVEGKYTRSVIAVLFPLLYCLLDGVGTFADAVLLEHMEESSANIAYEFTFFGMAVFAFIYVVGIKKQKISLKYETPKIMGACCETAGQLAYIYAIGKEAIVAAPMISSYCMFSLIWARLFLKEELSLQQYFVIGVAIAGIILLSFE